MYSPQHIDESLPVPAATEPLTLADHPEWTLGSMVGHSPVMQRLFSQMRSTARHLRIATVEGEGGTGKALAARTLHDLGPSPRAAFISSPAAQFFANGPILASPVPLLKDSRDGTLFLSHVEELSIDQQARLMSFFAVAR